MTWVIKLRQVGGLGRHYRMLPEKGEETTKKLCLAAKYDSGEQAEKILGEILEDNPQFEGKVEKWT